MGLRRAYPHERFGDLRIRERPLVPAAHAVLRQRGGDRVARRVVLAVALRGHPFQDRADTLPAAYRGLPLRRPDRHQDLHDVGGADAVHALRAHLRHRVVPRAGAPLCGGLAAVLPVLGVDPDDLLDGLLEGRHAAGPITGIAAFGDNPRVGERLLHRRCAVVSRTGWKTIDTGRSPGAYRGQVARARIHGLRDARRHGLRRTPNQVDTSERKIGQRVLRRGVEAPVDRASHPRRCRAPVHSTPGSASTATPGGPSSRARCAVRSTAGGTDAGPAAYAVRAPGLRRAAARSIRWRARSPSTRPAPRATLAFAPPRDVQATLAPANARAARFPCMHPLLAPSRHNATQEPECAP